MAIDFWGTGGGGIATVGGGGGKGESSTMLRDLTETVGEGFAVE